MIFVGIVFIGLIILVISTIDNEQDRYGLAFALLITGVACVFATYIVKCEATNDAVNLYKEGLLKEEITIKKTTEYGKTKIDTLYNYSRLQSLDKSINNF